MVVALNENCTTLSRELLNRPKAERISFSGDTVSEFLIQLSYHIFDLEYAETRILSGAWTDKNYYNGFITKISNDVGYAYIQLGNDVYYINYAMGAYRYIFKLSATQIA